MINDKIKEIIKSRGKLQLIVYEDFTKICQFGAYGLKDLIDIFIYKNEEEIIKIIENNLDNNKYCNVTFFSYDNKEDDSKFLKLFVEKSEEYAFSKNSSDYPFFAFPKTKYFSKEILYSYYLDK